MSIKSTGSHLLAPDQPPREFSEGLESVYEQLHRDVYKHLHIPTSLSQSLSFIERCKIMFYEIRDLLEDDYAISEKVARSLPVPDDREFVSELTKIIDSERSKTLFEEIYDLTSSETSKLDPVQQSVPDPDSFWMMLREAVFQSVRCLRIVQRRVYPHLPDSHKESYRFHWLAEPGAELADPRETMDFCFFPLPKTWGLRGDPYLWVHLAEKVSVVGMPDNLVDFHAQLRSGFKNLTGKEIDGGSDFYSASYAQGGMSSGYVSGDG